MRLFCVVLLAGLASACGNEGAGGSAEAASPEQQLAGGDAPAGAAAMAAVDNASGADGAGQAVAGAPADVAAAGPPGAAGGQSGTPATLPLPLGFYVASDIACADASNATLQLLRREGINTSRVPCDFDSVIKTGMNTYRVTQTCSEGGAAWGTEEHISTTTATFEILGADSFKSVYDDGWESVMKHCPQAELPEPWRDNDISDIVG